MGWSKTGMSKMAELRAYYYNKGYMLKLLFIAVARCGAKSGNEKVSWVKWQICQFTAYRIIR